LAHYNLGTALARADRTADAVVEFELALQLAPGFADAHYNLAVVLQQAGLA
jgi:Flp pilus assembly protein TadD